MNALLPPEYWQLEQSLPDDGEVIVDSFAGGGGASTGIELALGRSPDFAINHDAQALALHRANHPETIHLSKNIYKVDPIDVVGRRKVGLLWASPDCKHFSKAKGGAPVKREIRDLAWTVVLWAERVKPRVIILENVEEFQTWGPLIETAKGLQPDPERKGETFKEWVGALKRHGYKVEWRELRACDYGAPTTRKRLFLIARRDGRPIVWPAPTHGAPGDVEVIAGRKQPWRTAAEIINWAEPCPSIFDTAAEIWAKYGVRAVRPLAENTQSRIHKGYDRYVVRAAEPFVVTCNHGGEWFRGQGLDVPFHTVTATRDAHGLVMPHLSAAQHGGAIRSAAEPMRTIAASDKDQHQVVAAHLMTMRNAGKPFNEVDKPTHTITAGGAGLALVETKIEKVAAFLAQHNTGMVGHPVDAPLSTIVQRGTQQAVVSAGLMNLKGTDRRMSDVVAPVPTITSKGTHVAEVRAFLMKYYGADQDPRLEEPLATVTTRDRFGLVTVEGVDYQVVDIGMRMLTPRELFKAQGFPDHYRIDTGIFADGEARPLTKTAQIRMCGNSVCPPIAAALVGANCADLARQTIMEAAE